MQLLSYSRSVQFYCALFSLLCFLHTKGVAQENTTNTSPQFEVSSLREVSLTSTRSGGGGGVATYFSPRECVFLPDRINCALTLRGYIREAWGISSNEDYKLDTRLVPRDGFGRKGFALRATFTPGTSHDMILLMLQDLLQERFHLKMHGEERNLQAYALVMKPGKAHLTPTSALSPSERKDPLPFNFGITGNAAFLRGSAVDLNVLTSSISSNSLLSSPVINATGLTGTYKLDLTWESDPEVYNSHVLGDPLFLDALQKQTGLFLEKRTVPIRVFVIDSVSDSPTELN